MYCIDAIAFHASAPRRAKAMITHLGFHATPSGVWREGCATQLVNPLNTFSLGCGPGIPPALRGPSPRAPRTVAATRLLALPCHTSVWALLYPSISWRGRDCARPSPLGDAGVPGASGRPARGVARAPPRGAWPRKTAGRGQGGVYGRHYGRHHRALPGKIG